MSPLISELDKVRNFFILSHILVHSHHPYIISICLLGNRGDPTQFQSFIWICDHDLSRMKEEKYVAAKVSKSLSIKQI